MPTTEQRRHQHQGLINARRFQGFQNSSPFPLNWDGPRTFPFCNGCIHESFRCSIHEYINALSVVAINDANDALILPRKELPNNQFLTCLVASFRVQVHAPDRHTVHENALWRMLRMHTKPDKIMSTEFRNNHFKHKHVLKAPLNEYLVCSNAITPDECKYTHARQASNETRACWPRSM